MLAMVRSTCVVFIVASGSGSSSQPASIVGSTNTANRAWKHTEILWCGGRFTCGWMGNKTWGLPHSCEKCCVRFVWNGATTDEFFQAGQTIIILWTNSIVGLGPGDRSKGSVSVCPWWFARGHSFPRMWPLQRPPDNCACVLLSAAAASLCLCLAAASYLYHQLIY